MRNEAKTCAEIINHKRTASGSGIDPGMRIEVTKGLSGSGIVVVV